MKEVYDRVPDHEENKRDINKNLNDWMFLETFLKSEK